MDNQLTILKRDDLGRVQSTAESRAEAVAEYQRSGFSDLEDIAGGEYARELIPLLPPFDHQPVQGYRYLRELTDEPDCGACW